MKIFKKFIVVISVIFVVLLSGLVVYAQTWEYKFPIAIQDTFGTARTYYPVLFDFGGQSLVDSGKIAASGLDTNMQIGGSDIKYMVSTANITAVLPSLPSGGVVTTDLYTGYAPPQTTFPVIVGSSGNVTIPDRVAIRLGDDFAVVQKGWLVATAGTDKDLAIKEDAFDFSLSAAGTVTATVDPTGAAVSVSKAGLTSGEYEFVVSANVTDLCLWVNGVLEDTTPLGGASVPGNVNAWVLIRNNVMPYMDYFKIWVR